MKTVKLATFIENPDNPQTVTAEDFALLVESLRTMPQTLAASKIAYVTDYTAVDGADLRGQRVVIAGNKRLRALKQLAADHATSDDGAIKFDGPLPAEWFYDLTPLGPDTRRAWLVKSNVQSGEWDAEKLLALYDRDELGDLMGDEALEEILKAAETDEPKDGKTDPDAVPDAPEKPVSRRGEIYQLGNHRLMCGDSTSAADVTRLMGGDKADLYLTDPPYNVAVGLCERPNSSHNNVSIMNDNMAEDDFVQFLTSTFHASSEVMNNGAAFYIFYAGLNHTPFDLAIRNVPTLYIHEQLVWVKSHFVLGRNSDYQWAHDPIIYGWRKGAKHYFIDSRAESTAIEEPGAKLSTMKKGDLIELCRKLLGEKQSSSVIRADKPNSADLHPTVKPQSILAEFIRNSSKRGQNVLDSFGGSGSTLIACEQMSRKCFMMELDPHYCDVIRKRWAEFVHGEGCDWKALTPRAADLPRKEGK